MDPNSKFYETEIEAIRFDYILSLENASENVRGVVRMGSNKVHMVGYPELFQQISDLD